jgi:peptidoglycan/LPS O-acetylase OafA/YrhL
VETRADRLARRLARRTSSGRYIAEVDGLRFLAIALVVLFHSQMRVGEVFGGEVGAIPPAGNLVDVAFAQGRFGVHLFFVISGFILGLPFAAHHLAGARPVRLGAFYLRRLTRLEPPYLIALTIFFVLAVSAGGWSLWLDHRDVLVPRFGAGLVYAHGLFFQGELNPILPPSWSLEVEVQFYLLAPVLALVFTVRDRRARRALIVGGAAASAIAQWYMLEVAGFLPPTLLSYLQFFLVGFLLADVFLLEWNQRPTEHRSWDAIGLIAIVILLVGPPLALGERVQWIHQLFVMPALFGVAFCAAFRGPRMRTILTYRWIAVIGGMCYSIYLLHTPLMAMLAPHTARIGGAGYGTANVLVQFVVLGGIVLVVSAAFFAFVERPCMDPRWPSRFAARLRRLAQGSSEAERSPAASG